MRKTLLFTAVFMLTAIFSTSAFAQVDLTGTWELTKIVKDGADVPLVTGGKTPTIVFGDNNSISGNGSCNGYGGTYTLSGDSGFKTGPVRSTRMGCMGGINAQEMTFFNILQNAAIFKTDEGILHIADAGSKNILSFKRKGGDFLKSQFPETKEHFWIVNKEQVNCQAEAPRKCLQVKKTDAEPWENFYGTVQGFKYQPGKYSLIRVKATKKKNVPTNGSAYDYKLVKLISRTKLMPHVD